MFFIQISLEIDIIHQSIIWWMGKNFNIILQMKRVIYLVIRLVLMQS